MAVNALHVHECQSLITAPVDAALVCTKSYDTEWATLLIKDYLADSGFVVSLQNGMNEARIASVVGWGRTLGCIANAIGVEIREAGHAVRTYQPGGSSHTVFRIGEIHGRPTPRAEAVATALAQVDNAKITTNLWGERWSKLTWNSMSNGLEVIAGLAGKQLTVEPTARRAMIRLAGEAVAVGEALGYTLEPIFGIDARRWRTGVTGGDLYSLESAISTSPDSTSEMRSSTARDFANRRRLEIPFLNGLIADKGTEVGVATPAHDNVVALTHAIEKGELKPSKALLDQMLG